MITGSHTVSLLFLSIKTFYLFVQIYIIYYDTGTLQ